ncbi:MAG: DUF2087 domain-containing protein [Clostridia bacterium]
MEVKCSKFLDEEGRVKQLPAKNTMRQEIFLYLSSKFAGEIRYSEKEVNQLLNLWSTIGDYFILRRGLIDSDLLCRTKDGREYWKNMSKMDEQEQV